ncbi:MAG: hypothetical protein ABJ013_04190 [Halioglobus sp.]
MSPDQIRDLTIVLFVIGAILFPFIYFSRFLIEKYIGDALYTVDSLIAARSHDIEVVALYTSGHPYIWAEITRDELIEMIRDDCRMPVAHTTGGISVWKRPEFLLNFNEERNSLHVVFTREKTFDWSSLKFHDEYSTAP